MLLRLTPSFSQAAAEFAKARNFASAYRIDSAYVHMQNAVRLSKNSNERFRALVYVQYGKLLKLREKTDSTFFYFQRSADIYKRHRQNDSLLYLTTSIAELFRFRDNKEKAAHYIKEAERLLTKKTPANILAYYYNRRAAIEYMFFSRDIAFELSQKVIAMQNEVTDKEIVVYSYNELGSLYRTTDIPKSNSYYFAALALAEKHQLPIAKADVLVNLSYRAAIDDKIRYLEQAFSIARKIDNKDMQFKFANLLFWPYKDKQDYKKAFEYCYLALDLQEKMYDSRALAKTAEIERKYNLSKAEQDLNFKNAEVAGARRTLVLIVIVAALTFIVLLVLIYFFRKTRNNNKMLAQLSQENEFLLSEANHRINNNLQLITIMISDELRKTGAADTSSLNKLLSKVESIAVLHRHLYKADNKRNIEVGAYLREVLDNFAEVFAEQGIRTSYAIDNFPVQNEDAIYMGLLVTELCINTLKHAFVARQDKEVSFILRYEKDVVHFKFEDNGLSVKGKDIRPKLVDKLCRQLKVSYSMTTSNGFLFYFEKNYHP